MKLVTGTVEMTPINCGGGIGPDEQHQVRRSSAQRSNVHRTGGHVHDLGARRQRHPVTGLGAHHPLLADDPVFWPPFTDVAARLWEAWLVNPQAWIESVVPSVGPIVSPGITEAPPNTLSRGSSFNGEPPNGRTPPVIGEPLPLPDPNAPAPAAGDERIPLASFYKELDYWDALIRQIGGSAP